MIDDFLLTLNEFRLQHISDMVSDIQGVGGGEDDGLELGWFFVNTIIVTMIKFTFIGNCKKWLPLHNQLIHRIINTYR